MLEQQIGEPVELGALAGAWDGWNPRLDIDNLRVVDGKNGTPLLILPAVHLTVGVDVPAVRRPALQGGSARSATP